MDALRAEEARQLRVLLAVHEVAGGRTGESVGTDDIHVLLGGELFTDRDSLEDILTLLVSRGFLQGYRTYDGLNDVFLTASGKSLALDFSARREDRFLRLRQLQDDYLRWLYTEVETGEGSPTPNAYLATQPSYYGSSYTSAELEKAGERLAEGAFIKGQAAWQYRAPIRPQLTAKGRHTVEAGRSVHDSYPDASSGVHNNYSTTVYGSANVANASSHITQEIRHEDWAPRVEAILQAIVQALDALPTQTSRQVAPLLDEAQTAVEHKDLSRTRRALEAVGAFLTDSTAGALGTVLGAQALTLFASLGN